MTAASDAAAGLSRRLRSRHETGAVLRQSGVPVIELRSGVVLGAGSLSFELIRSLVERLLLAAEMKLPGRGWLEFRLTPRPHGGCTVRQTAVFDPRGLAGRRYWHALYPVHALLFRGLLRNIARRAVGGST